MWTLETPWYELVIRSAVIYFFAFVIVRVWGRKHLGDLSIFDFIVLLFLSEAIQNSLVGDEKSIPGGMIVFITLLVLTTLFNKLSYHSHGIEKILEGSPRVLIWKGQVDEEALKDEEITWQELHEAIRDKGVLELKDVKQATLESNGHISVIEEKNA